MEPLEWCRRRMLVPGNPLTATLPFAAADQRDAILAVRTVIAEIAAAGREVGEAAVAEAKLDWWRKALRESSPHPAIKALAVTGVAHRLTSAEFEPLIEAVSASMANPRFENTEQAWQFFQTAGGAASVVEARLIEPHLGVDSLFAQLGAAAYLVRVTRDLAIDARANRWLVPLDLQAEFQVSRQDALGTDARPAFAGLVRALLDLAVGRADQALQQLESDRAWQHRHLLLMWALDRHLARTIARNPRRILHQRVLPRHSGNVWRAWRAARRLRTGKIP